MAGYDPTQLPEGLTQYWNTSELSGVLPLYYNHAPQGKSRLPYCVWFPVSSVTSYTMSDSQNNQLIQFSIYTSDLLSVQPARTWAEKVSNILDEATFPLSGQTIIRTSRESQREFLDPQKGYYYQLDYMFYYEEDA